MERETEAYTQHIKKDRWLRKQGWKVYRITNKEIEEYESFDNFFYELLGKYIVTEFDIPF